jgi:hypothetical protein
MTKRKKAQRNTSQQRLGNPTPGPAAGGDSKPKKLRQGKYTLKDLTYPDQRVVRFPIVGGKTTETIELLTSTKFHYVTVAFTDKTSLSIAIEPAFNFKAAYEYVKRGKPHAKLWPEIRSSK